MATFSLTDFLKEARRRRVFRLVALYIVGAFVALQVADLAFPGLGIAESAIRYVWMGAILGLPIALFFSWRYDIIGGRIVRTPVSDVDVDLSIGRVDIVILGALSIVVAVIAFGLVGEVSKTRVTETAPRVFAATNPNSIAVLPFLNMSEDPNNEYFADGISEEILNLLTKIRELQVTSRSSAFSFKGQNLDVPAMAAKLNVAHILEGSVRKSGNQLRITTQLIDVATDKHLWSETYDRTLDNIFAIQDEIAAAVVDALKIELLGEAPKATETNPEAYALYLQGMHSRRQNTIDGYEQAETLLKQALDIDPEFAPAWNTLGDVYANQGFAYGILTVDEAYRRARTAIKKALDLDPNYARAWSDLGDLELHYNWDFTLANQHVQKALALNPGDTYILKQVAEMADTFGRLDEAIDLYRQFIALDPLSPMGHGLLGRAYYRAHRLEEAAESYQLARSLSPPGGRPFTGLLLAQGDAQAALEVFEQLDVGPRRLTGIAIAQHALGNAEASDAALQELIEWDGAQTWALRVAQVYAFRGEVDSAFDWLDQAFDNRENYLPGNLFDPLFDNLRDDPRWPAFLDKMGFPQ